jgi:hypothetical protein
MSLSELAAAILNPKTARCKQRQYLCFTNVKAAMFPEFNIEFPRDAS